MTSNELKSKLLQTGCFEENSYLYLYVHLIISNSHTIRERGVTQSHHIIPRVYFQLNNKPLDNSKENIVQLKYIDHITAHYYLSMCAIGEEFTTWCVYAFKLMSGGKNIISIISDKSAMDRIQSMYESIYSIKIKKKEKVLSSERLSEIHKDTVWINNGVVNKKVKKEMLDSYVNCGWVKGRMEQSSSTSIAMQKVRSQNGKKIAGMIWIHKGEIETRVHPEEVNALLTDGWCTGRSPQTEQKLLEGHKRLRGRTSPTKGKKLPTVSAKMKGNTRTLNMIFINNGDKNKRILRGTESSWIEQGWKLGRLPRSRNKS